MLARALVGLLLLVGSAPSAGAQVTLKWSGEWFWTRPMVLFGKPAPSRGPRLSIELLPNNQVKFCYNVKEPQNCQIVGFTEKRGVYRLFPNKSNAMEVRLIADGLVGEFWWDRKNQQTTTPDGTFFLK